MKSISYQQSPTARVQGLTARASNVALTMNHKISTVASVAIFTVTLLAHLTVLTHLPGCAVALTPGASASPSPGPTISPLAIYNPVDTGVVPNITKSNVMVLNVTAGNAVGTPSSPGAYCDPTCTTDACLSKSTYAGRPCLYANEPTATVTLCQPGSTTVCQTFNNLLVDTGSTGLRIYSNAQDSNGVPLMGAAKSVFPSVPAPASSLWTCAEYGDGSSQWGQVQKVDLWLGSGGPTSSTPGEVASKLNIEVIQYDPTGVGGSYCIPGSVADTSPQQSGFNGILGVGLALYDCNLNIENCYGTVGCSSANVAAGNCYPQGYYTCTGANGTNCKGANPTSNSQMVQNPVNGLVTDNNGVILEFTGNVPIAGTTALSGYMILGIGTQPNNALSTQVNKYSVYSNSLANAQQGLAGTFMTQFQSVVMSSFIDSGSNFLYFPAPSNGSLPSCADDPSHTYFCPASTVTLQAINTGSDGIFGGGVQFQIANADAVYLDQSSKSPNSVFIDVGGSSGSLEVGSVFDWGFPFFLGKSIYVGYDMPNSSPYWAY